MRLASIYIPENTLPYIFGKNHKGLTLNLGGEYFYNFKENKDAIFVGERILNNNFIEDFWSKGIALISAIVGRNGIGKTSVLRGINQGFDIKHINAFYIFEDRLKDDKIHIVNETSKKTESVIQFILEKNLEKNFEKQYYSPVLDYELIDTKSAISLVNYATGTLEDYYLDSITRNILFLSEPVINDLKKIYKDFPFYDKYIIGVSKIKKSHFRSTYIETNLGNPNRGDVLRNYLTGDIIRLENDPTDTKYSKEQLIQLYKENVELLDTESFTSLFNKLWASKEYSSKNEFDYIHNSDAFIKNLEVTLLSYLILGAVFPQTGMGGSFSFDEVLQGDIFEVKLNALLELYLANEYESLYEEIKIKLKGISVEKKVSIIEMIESDKFSKIGGTDTAPVKSRMKRDVEMFFLVKDFYDHLFQLISDSQLNVKKGSLIFDIEKNDISVYNTIVDKYKGVISSLKHLPVSISILEFIPNKKLSSGEKSLIDFYSSINNYIDRLKNSPHQCHENYLLLLDEPELGYHPIWKKKFISAIVKTLPILFAKITPHKYDEQLNKYVKSDNANPNLQIIFSTHDPLTLSDIPNSNIIYFDNSKGNFTEVINKEKGLKKSFGANISDLLADSFFIEDGLVGEYAVEKINATIDWLRDKEKRANAEYHKKLINTIDEPIIKQKLAEMYTEKMDVDFSREILMKQIENLKKNYKDQTGEDYDSL